MTAIQIISILFLFFISSIAQECGISNPIEEQETEGIATLGKWPWQVIVTTPLLACGGTIIDERWVLTAAHCFNAQLNGRVFEEKPKVRTGVVNIEKEDGSILYDVQKFYTHAKYNNKTYENDIALLKLELPIVYSKTVSSICLVNDITGEISEYGSNVLRETSIQLSPKSKCKAEWDVNGNTDKLICAGSHGIGAGKGDSGGPLMVQSVGGPWYQIGVVSFGRKDSEIATKHTIGGYTSVGHYCEWIKEVTGGDAKCTEKEVDMRLLPEEEREIDSQEAKKL